MFIELQTSEGPATINVNHIVGAGTSPDGDPTKSSLLFANVPDEVSVAVILIPYDELKRRLYEKTSHR